MNVSVFKRLSDDVNLSSSSNSIMVCGITDAVSTLIWLAVWLLAAAMGIPGNILCTIVWFRRHIAAKNSSAVYLAALAVDDLIYQLLELLFFFVFTPCGIQWTWLGHGVWYLSRTATGLEPLLVLGFSVERLIAIFRPLQVRFAAYFHLRYMCYNAIR